MLELRQRFIDLAVRPLARKAEAEEMARGELMDRLSHASPGKKDDPLEDATARLEHRAKVPWWVTTVLLLGATVALWVVIAPRLHAGWKELMRLNPHYRALPFRHYDHEAWEQQLTQGLDAAERRFLLSNCHSLGIWEQNEILEMAHAQLPSDAAELEELAALQREKSTLDPGRTSGHGRTIDPGNALWHMLEAESLSRASINGYPYSGKRTIRRPTDYEKACGLLEEASRQPRLLSRIPRRTVQRLALLGPANDVAGRLERSAFAGIQRGALGNLLSIDNLWITRAEELTAAANREGLAAWIAAWDRIAMLNLQANSDERAIPIFYRGRTGQHLAKQAAALGLTAEEERLKRWEHAFALAYAMPSSFRFPPQPTMAAFTGGYWFHFFPEIASKEEFEAGLRAEWALADRFFALTTAGLFAVLAAFAAFEGWRRRAAVTGLARGLSPLLRPVDFLWLGVLGVILPLAWYVGITCFTPLGCRDFSVAAWFRLPAPLHAAGGFLLAACAAVQTVRWRLAKRGGVLGLRPPALWPGWVMVAVAACFGPAMGAVRYLPKWQAEFLVFGSSMGGLPLLWLLWRAGAMLFGPTSAALGGVMACRMLLPYFVAMSGLLLALTPALKDEERTWLSRESLGETDPAGSGFNRLNARASEIIEERLRKAME